MKGTIMTVDDFVQHLHSYPETYHALIRPANQEDVSTLEHELGTLPPSLRRWLEHHNGGELYLRSGPLLTLFGVSDSDSFAPSYGWSIRTFTKEWRQRMPRATEWVIGIRNDGRLILLGGDGYVKEWDTNLKKWSGHPMPLSDWLTFVAKEGQEYLAP
jgi:hypothetical protein